MQLANFPILNVLASEINLWSGIILYALNLFIAFNTDDEYVFLLYIIFAILLLHEATVVLV